MIEIHIVAGIVYKSYIIFEKYLKNGILDFSILSIKQIIKEFLYNGFYYHLWYLPALVWGIILLWIFIKIKKVKIIYFFIILIYLLLGIFNEVYFAQYFQEKVIKEILHLKNAIFFGMVFIIMGYLYSEIKDKINKRITVKKLYVVLTFLILMFIERFIVYKITGIKEEREMYYITMLPLTYFIVDYFISREKINNRILAKIGENSVGIYLYHWLVMIILIGIYNSIEIFNNMLIYHLLLAPTVFIGTYLLYINTKKINIKNLRDKIIRRTK